MLDPVVNGRFVALDGPAGRFLGTPPQGVQQSANVIDVIANAEATSNELTDASAGPKIARKTGRLSPLEQSFLQLSFLLSTQLGRPAGGWLGAQGLPAPFPVGGLPASHAAAVDSEQTGHLDRQVSLLQQFDGTLTSMFQLLWAAVRSHDMSSGADYTGSVGHYLYSSQ